MNENVGWDAETSYDEKVPLIVRHGWREYVPHVLHAVDDNLHERALPMIVDIPWSGGQMSSKETVRLPENKFFSSSFHIYHSKFIGILCIF